uniref:Uncharacterized protein n=1 Tax=Anopheles atroparvus TaxID=41427 RepID=A0A182JA85_ANOAO
MVRALFISQEATIDEAPLSNVWGKVIYHRRKPVKAKECPKTRNTNLVSQLQWLIVKGRKLNSSNWVPMAGIISLQWSCFRQHMSARDAPPSWWYRAAECPLPHHFVFGDRNQSEIARLCLPLLVRYPLVLGIGTAQSGRDLLQLHVPHVAPLLELVEIQLAHQLLRDVRPVAQWNVGEIAHAECIDTGTGSRHAGRELVGVVLQLVHFGRYHVVIDVLAEVVVGHERVVPGSIGHVEGGREVACPRLCELGVEACVKLLHHRTLPNVLAVHHLAVAVMLRSAPTTGNTEAKGRIESVQNLLTTKCAELVGPTSCGCRVVPVHFE